MPVLFLSNISDQYIPALTPKPNPARMLCHRELSADPDRQAVQTDAAVSFEMPTLAFSLNGWL
jgi:hypothetical protein